MVLLERLQCNKCSCLLIYILYIFSLMKLSLAMSYSKFNFHFSKKTVKQFSQLTVSSPAPPGHSISFTTSVSLWWCLFNVSQWLWRAVLLCFKFAFFWWVMRVSIFWRFCWPVLKFSCEFSIKHLVCFSYWVDLIIDL